MAVRAVMSMLGPGVATPAVGGTGGGVDPPLTTTLPWHEPFNQVNYAALQTKYAGTTSSLPASGGFLSVNAGTFEIKGDPSVAGSPQAVEIDVPLSTHYAQIWMRVQLEMLGGAYDSNSCALQSFIYDSLSGLEADIDGFGDGTGTWEMFLWPGPTNPDSGIDHRFAAGAHTFIMCASEVSPTLWRGELWVDASPGDAADIDATNPKTAGAGFDNINVILRGPEDALRTVRFLDIEIRDGTRASDPFGIL